MEMTGQAHALATLSLGEESSTNWTGGWVGPPANLVVLEKIKSHAPAVIQTLDHPACSPVTEPAYALPVTIAYSIKTKQKKLLPMKDKACFHLNGYVISQNTCHWDSENPKIW